MPANPAPCPIAKAAVRADERSEDLGARLRRAVAGAAMVIAISVMTIAVRAVRQNKPFSNGSATIRFITA